MDIVKLCVDDGIYPIFWGWESKTLKFVKYVSFIDSKNIPIGFSKDAIDNFHLMITVRYSYEWIDDSLSLRFDKNIILFLLPIKQIN